MLLRWCDWSGNRVLRNRLLHLNTAKCETCFYAAGEPDMLISARNALSGNGARGFGEASAMYSV